MTSTRYLTPLNRRMARLRYRLVEMVIERDKRFCRMCGADEYSICPNDHKPVGLSVALILPVSQGGRVIPDNLKTICSTCRAGLKEIANSRGNL